jgi:hypothetical protein
MDAAERGRRLFFHGMLLVVVGLVVGLVVPAFANPRMGLSAHTGMLMNGILLIAMGAFWSRLATGPSTETIAWWLVVVRVTVGSSRSPAVASARISSSAVASIVVCSAGVAGALVTPVFGGTTIIASAVFPSSFSGAPMSHRTLQRERTWCWTALVIG